MARQCWDESRHCEISIKLGDHMGTEIGEYTETTFLYAAACNPDPVLRLMRREPRARRPRHRRVQHDEGVRRRVRRPGARVLRGLDARRRGDPREDGLRLAAPPHRRTTRSGASARSSSSAPSTSIFNLGGFRGEDEENPIQLARRFRELAGFTDDEIDEIARLSEEALHEADSKRREARERAQAAVAAS